MNAWLFAAAVSNPWQIGPAPSAHWTAQGVSVGASASVVSVRTGTPLAGARGAIAATLHSRLWSSVDLSTGSSWRTCPDCRATTVNWTARGLAVRSKAFNLAGWSVVNFLNGTFEWTPGAALEGGSERLRFDFSTPVWSTWDLLTTLRITPEAGVSYAWSNCHATRLAVVGLEPAIALSHRTQFLRWGAEYTIRIGEEGLLLEIGAHLR